MWLSIRSLTAVAVASSLVVVQGCTSSDDDSGAGGAAGKATAGAGGSSAGTGGKGGAGHAGVAGSSGKATGNAGEPSSGGAGGENEAGGAGQATAGGNAAGGASAGGESAGGAGGQGGAAGETSSGPTLYGSHVVYSGHCCDAPPSDANLLGAEREADVGPGVEFPDLSGTNGSISTIPADIDIEASSVVITYHADETTAEGDFNGYVLDFSGTASPRITNVAFSTQSTVNLSSATADFDAHSVLINLPGTTVGAGKTIVLELTLSAD